MLDGKHAECEQRSKRAGTGTSEGLVACNEVHLRVADVWSWCRRLVPTLERAGYTERRPHCVLLELHYSNTSAFYCFLSEKIDLCFSNCVGGTCRLVTGVRYRKQRSALNLL